jgi:hypothetical protein
VPAFDFGQWYATLRNLRQGCRHLVPAGDNDLARMQNGNFVTQGLQSFMPGVLRRRELAS